MVKGPDLDTIQGLAGMVMGLASSDEVKKTGVFSSFRPSFELGKPELQVLPDREKASALGLTVSDLGYVVGTMVEGTLAGDFRRRRAG